jgi:phosphopantetheine--protein transferase-like protein
MFTDKLPAGGPVFGVGIDVMYRGRIYRPYLQPDDPFLRATYTEREREAASLRRDPSAFYETRFCCKEAVFKTLGISGEHVRFNEIEILSDENGRPIVTLLGTLAAQAAEKGIAEVLLSLSYDQDIAQAIAIACTSRSAYYHRKGTE